MLLTVVGRKSKSVWFIVWAEESQDEDKRIKETN